ncbi:hypothetical protein ACFOPN_09310 [Xanthomonas hyacinthi]|uniref:hypothetical protein n=1 Tax=Xanthomonas hyacinthi TaxID=56455 RepID=UPI0036170DFE
MARLVGRPGLRSQDRTTLQWSGTLPIGDDGVRFGCRARERAAARAAGDSDRAGASCVAAHARSAGGQATVMRGPARTQTDSAPHPRRAAAPMPQRRHGASAAERRAVARRCDQIGESGSTLL